MLIRNFLFHRVSTEKDELWPPMTPDLFKRAIGYITSNFTVVSLEAYLQNGSYTKNGKNKLATVLFDDGYKDNIEYAAPILDSFRCPASFYVVTDGIERDIPTWTYQLDNVLQKTKIKKLRFDFGYVPENMRNLVLMERELVKKLKPWMKTLPNHQRGQMLESVMQQCTDVIPTKGLMMNWNDLRQLKAAGFEIGSHSHTHPMLASLRNETEITEELSVSYQLIEKELNIRPAGISYPIGSYDDRVKRLSVAAGYQFGLAVEQRFYNDAQDDKFAIPRVELYQEPWWKVKARVNGIYHTIKRMWK